MNNAIRRALAMGMTVAMGAGIVSSDVAVTQAMAAEFQNTKIVAVKTVTEDAAGSIDNSEVLDVTETTTVKEDGEAAATEEKKSDEKALTQTVEGAATVKDEQSEIEKKDDKTVEETTEAAKAASEKITAKADVTKEITSDITTETKKSSQTVTETSTDVNDFNKTKPQQTTAENTTTEEKQTAAEQITQETDKSQADGLTEGIEEPDAAAESYNGLTYSINTYNNEVTITGYTGNGGTVNIPAKIGNYPVTEIQSGAFYNNTKITEVNIPASVTELGSTYGNGAFEGCSNLKTVTIKGGTNKAYIGSSAFSGCISLKTITIPANYTNIYDSAFSGCRSLAKVVYNGAKYEQNIGNRAFYGCSSLTGITLSGSVRSIGYDAFYNCTALASVNIPEGVTKVDYGAFYGCKSLKSVTVPSTVTQLGALYSYDGVFQNCVSLTSVTLKAGNKSAIMGSNTFQGCKSLTSITIPGNYSNIKDYAFKDCSALKTVNYAASVKNINHVIESYVFQNCQALTTVKLGAGLESIGRYAFNNCTALTAIDIPAGTKKICQDAFLECTRLATVNLSEGLTSIESAAFKSCNMLKSITIPSTVTSISGESYYGGAFEDCSGLTTVTIKAGNTQAEIGDYAFKNCKSLISVTVPGNYKNIGREAFAGCNSLKNFTYAASVNNIEHYIGYESFKECGSLSTVSFGKGLVGISNGAFESTNILKLTIPEGVTDIGGEAFKNCKALTSVTIPSTMKNIGSTNSYDGAFENCISLTNVSITAGKNNDSAIGSHAFKGCTSLKNITIPGNYYIIGNYAFSGCTSLETLDYKKSSYEFANQSIGREAFYGCSSLKSIKLSTTLKTIGDSAFSGCKALIQTVIPEGVEQIGDSAFDNCEGLQKASIPSTVKSIPYGCFRNCISLKDITIAKGVNDSVIESYAFENCQSLTSLSIPGNYTTIENYAMRNCTALEKVSWEEGQYSYANQSIKYAAFYQDKSLSVVTLPSTVSSIDDQAFAGCGTFTIEGVKGSAAESYAGQYGHTFKTYSQPLSVKVVINPSDNTWKGDVVSIQAVATGGSNSYTYKLVVYNEDTKKWGLVEDYGPSGGFTWTASTAGNRKFYVKVKDSTGKEVLSQAVTNVNKEFRAAASYKQVDKTVQFTANAKDASGSCQYKFIVYNEATKKWGIVQDYSSKNTCTWNMANATAGNRKFYVDIKDSNGNVARSAAMNINISASKLTASLKASASQVNLGSTVKLTATASGGYGNYQYKFIVYNEATKQWGKVQDYSSKSTCSWKASSNGTRKFYVDIKDAKGNVTRSAVSTVKAGADIKVTSTISTNANKAGSNVMLAATATGGNGGYTYKFIVYNKNTNKWGLIRNFSATNAITWKASSAGNRVFYVDVKDSKGNVVRSTPMNLKTTK